MDRSHLQGVYNIVGALKCVHRQLKYHRAETSRAFSPGSEH